MTPIYDSLGRFAGTVGEPSDGGCLGPFVIYGGLILVALCIVSCAACTVLGFALEALDQTAELFGVDLNDFGP